MRSIPSLVRSLAPLTAAIISMGAGGTAHADLYINSAVPSIDGFNGTAASVKYRMSNSNWDMSLDNGKGTGSTANFIGANLGNNNQMSSRTYEFTLTHLAGQGLIWQLTDLGSGSTTTQAWGAFESNPGGTVQSALNGITPGASFNTLLIEARATRSGSSLEFSNLAFNSELAVADGAFTSGVVTPSTGGPGNSNGFWNQTLVSTTDLASANWSFTGQIQGIRSGSGGDEEVRFTIAMRDANVTIPAPGALALVLVGGLIRRAGSRRSDRG
ncbi:MAG: hypothetical protein KF724_08810 [Phycisphaeraceae bacterium]|nr:hypothetical protein [Phycisphaeraceae bacterium]